MLYGYGRKWRLPGDYRKNIKIQGLEDVQFGKDVLLFHAGTKLADTDVVTNGGRVLAVTSFANNIKSAVAKSKDVLSRIHFDGMYYRKDIGFEFEE
jgi:phosphoribosylamine--glycine ligase